MNNQTYHMDRANGYPDTLVSAAEINEADVPITPLPNPGEGGPVDSGNSMDNGAGVPVIPLPNPGEGGPVDSGRPNFPPRFRPMYRQPPAHRPSPYLAPTDMSTSRNRSR